jgi:tRNA pseudouridine-54 N-methylase
MRVFALVFGRAPTATEFTAAAAVTAADRLPALCRVLLNANEFAFIE